MAVNSPKGVAAQFDVDDKALVDDLVRASLAINPQLRNGQRTTEVLQRLRDQITQGNTPGPSKTPDAPIQNKRKRAIQVFLDLKSDDFYKTWETVQRKRRQLEDEERDIKKQAVDDIVDHLKVVLAAGGDTSDAQACLRDVKPLLTQLGVTYSDILRQLRR